MKRVIALGAALLLSACGNPRAIGTGADTTTSSARTATSARSQPIAATSLPAYFACADAGACPPQAGLAAAFDPIREEIVTFGGWDYPDGQIQVRDSTWRFKGGEWLQLHPAHVPPPRDTAVLVFDPARSVVVMYGGRDVPASATAGTGGDVGQITFAADTWTWDGSDWTEQHPAHHPVLFVPFGTYDYERNEVVLLGISSGGMDTWTFNGADWTQHAAAQGKLVPPRLQGWLSFDPVSKTVATFGGFSQGADVTALWEWNGQQWTRTVAAGPAVHLRMASNMAPDLDEPAMLLYDSDGGGAQSSTWRWNGRAFQQVQPSHEPGLPALGLAADPPRHRLLLFGRTWPGRQFQVWSWSGNDWRLVTV